MSATCDKCSSHYIDHVHLCPLHAEAEAMRDVLRIAREASNAIRADATAMSRRIATDHPVMAFVRSMDDAARALDAAARPILARIEGRAE